MTAAANDTARHLRLVRTEDTGVVARWKIAKESAPPLLAEAIAAADFGKAHRILVAIELLMTGNAPDLQTLTKSRGAAALKARAEKARQVVDNDNNFARAEYRFERHVLRKQRARALRWLYRAAGIPRGDVPSPVTIAAALFGRAYYGREDWSVEGGTGYYLSPSCGAMLTREGEKWIAVIRDGSDDEKMRHIAWCCAALACRAARSLERVASWKKVAELEHMIADELVRAYANASAEVQ
jgi:hypothetical protein